MSAEPSLVPELAVTDCDVSVRFWRDLLAFEVLYDRPEEGFAYLALGDAHLMLDVLVEQRRQPLSPELPACTFGNMARDGGGLIVEATDHDAFAADPVASRYLRPFVGARELLHDLPRWCLWMVDLDPRDVAASPLLKERLEFVRETRAKSRAASTAAMAATPHLFGQRSQPDVPYLVIPKTSSETRLYFPTKHAMPETIASDLVFTAKDSDGFLFGIISSSMFLTWQKSVGGALESRLRFSNTIVWNNLPLPTPSMKTRSAVIAAGKDVLAARALHPQRSLAEHYNPLAMDPALLKAHAGLDRVVDKAFGARKSLHTEQDRQAVLFRRYAELTA